jgi:carboxymethylenebutenolidase
MYFGVASNDDKSQPDAKDKLKEAFGSKAEVEVYGEAQHGWCVPDMPAGPSGPIYKKDDAEKAWAKLLALYKANIA